MTMGDRIVVMKDGVVQQIDAPLKVYHEPANLFVAGFLGTPPMNLVHGTLHRNDGHLIFTEKDAGSLTVELANHPAWEPFVDKAVIVGIRPEDLRPLSPGETPSSRSSFFAVVDLVEPMGGETNIYLQTGRHPLTCRTQGAVLTLPVGARAPFEIVAAKVHLFDPATGNRVI